MLDFAHFVKYFFLILRNKILVLVTNSYSNLFKSKIEINSINKRFITMSCDANNKFSQNLTCNIFQILKLLYF